MYNSGYFLPMLAWPGLTWLSQHLPHSCLMPAPVLVPCAGGSPVDKIYLPSPQLLFPIPSVYGLVDINKERLQSGRNLVSEAGFHPSLED